MSDFKAKMHQIRFRPTGGAYSTPPDSLAGFKRPNSKGREGRGKEGREGERRDGKKGEGKGWGRHSISCLRVPQT